MSVAFEDDEWDEGHTEHEPEKCGFFMGCEFCDRETA